MNYKKFTYYLVSFFFVFVILNLYIWTFYTKDILSIKSNNIHSGDLSRMGYMPVLNHYRKNETTLNKVHLNNSKELPLNIDMITIGDSFSTGGAGGLNKFYQDYLSSYSNFNILNIHELKNSRSYIETIVMMLNNGILDKYKVKYILIESTQRKVVNRFELPFRDDLIVNNINFQEYLYNTKSNQVHSLQTLSKVSMINNGNFKYILYNLLYNFSDKAFISKVYKVKLSKKLFTINEGNDLLFYKKDITSILNNIKQRLESVNNNLNKLSNLLSKHKIQLIFMPVVSKYDLYSKYIIDNNHKTDPFFEIYRKFDRNYIFIDTKKILSKELEQNEKDIFYIDDTHWSYKASDVISKDIIDKINK